MVSSLVGARFFRRTDVVPSSSALTTALPPPLENLLVFRGVTIGFIIEFTNTHGCWDWTTSRVVRDLIQPATASTTDAISFAEVPRVRDSGVVGRAETFISHCHGALWGTLVAALADGGANRSRRVWLDVFALPFGKGVVERIDLGGVIRSCACLDDQTKQRLPTMSEYCPLGHNRHYHYACTCVSVCSCTTSGCHRSARIDTTSALSRACPFARRYLLCRHLPRCRNHSTSRCRDLPRTLADATLCPPHRPAPSRTPRAHRLLPRLVLA